MAGVLNIYVAISYLFVKLHVFYLAIYLGLYFVLLNKITVSIRYLAAEENFNTNLQVTRRSQSQMIRYIIRCIPR